MSLRTLTRSWYDNHFLSWYTRWAPAMVIACIATVVLVTIGTYSNYATLEADRQSREKDNARLLGCFDEYASASAATSKAVRVATVAVDQARVRRDRALQVMLEFIATNPPAGDPRGARLFAVVLAANSGLVTAQTELDKVRRDNPVPDPPSEFCTLP